MSDRERKRVARIEGYTPERQTAERLGFALRTMRKWRHNGVGPAYVKFGRQIHYRDEAIAAWLKRCEVNPIRETAIA
jgi:predicted site-specific integrase-resolvase